MVRQNNTNFSDVLSGETKKHYSNIDLARSIAILAVVLCHANTEVYKYGYEAMNSLPQIDQNAATLFLTFGRMGVPLFLYISGFLLLQKEYTIDSSVSFWKRKLWTLVYVTEIWIVLYNIFFIAMGSSIRFQDIVLEIAFLKLVPMPHVWYMPMIIGVYCFIPFVSNALKKISVPAVWFPLTCGIVVSFLFPTIQILLSQLNSNYYIAPLLDFGFSGGVYGIYLVLGQVLRPAQKRRQRWYFVIMFIATGAAFGYQRFLYYWQGYDLWYNCVFLLLATMALWKILLGIPLQTNGIFCFIIKKIADCSFGIYLLHYPVLVLIAPGITLSNRAIRTLILWGGASAIAFILTLGISKFKYGKVLLMTK